MPPSTNPPTAPPYNPNKTPYKPTPPKPTPKPYNPNKTPKPGNPYTYPGPAPNKGKCPYDPNSCGGGCPADCPNSNPPMCSLKYVGRCYNNLFNKVYKNICRW